MTGLVVQLGHPTHGLTWTVCIIQYVQCIINQIYYHSDFSTLSQLTYEFLELTPLGERLWCVVLGAGREEPFATWRPHHTETRARMVVKDKRGLQPGPSTSQPYDFRA